jgi:predicted aconitase with swiveling domain
MSATFKCGTIAGGRASGPALVSDEPICFYLIEPETGVVVEGGHVLEGKSMEGTVLVAHAGKGSSVVQMDGLYKISVRRKGPVAVVLRNPDPVFVSALLVMEIPSVYDVDEKFFDFIAGRDGAMITVDATGGLITVEA